MKHQMNKKINLLCRTIASKAVEVDEGYMMPRRHHEYLARLFCLAVNKVLLDDDSPDLAQNPLDLLPDSDSPTRMIPRLSVAISVMGVTFSCHEVSWPFAFAVVAPLHARTPSKPDAHPSS